MQLVLILTTVLASVLSLQASTVQPDSPGVRLLLTFLLGLAVIATAGMITARAAYDRRDSKRPGSQALRRYVRGRKWHLALYVISILTIYGVLQYPSIVKSHPAGQRIVLADDLLCLLPLILPLLGSWAVFSRLATPGQHGGRITRRSLFSARARDVVLQARHYLLLPLCPILTLIAVQDTLRLQFPTATSRAEGTLLLGCLVALGLFLPGWLRWIWPTRSLPTGWARAQVESIMGRAGLRVTDILIWKTERQMVNAATAGVLPQCRYVLLSDGLLDRRNEQHFRAIVAHEAGHMRHHHAATLLLSLTIPLLALLAVQGLLERAGVTAAQATVGSVFVLAFWIGVHSGLARMLEHQADVAACHLIGATNRLQAESVEQFGQALRAAAQETTGRDWLHPSTTSRIALLHHLLRHANHELEFQRHVRYAKRLLAALALLFFSLGVL